MTTLFLSAGEVSGDMHGAYLARALRERHPEIKLVGIGGPRMAEAGVELIADVTAHSAVGLIEQIPHVLPVMRAFKLAHKALAELRPARVVLIDYQGANLALAKQARKLGLGTTYYIAPQDWLWHLPGGGPRKVMKAVDHVLAVFPKEAAIYGAAGGRVTYVGHPLVDIIGAEPRQKGDGQVVALLPGSRTQEVAHLYPLFMEVAHVLHTRRPGVRFILPAASDALYEELRWKVAGQRLPIELTRGNSLDALRRADAALMASGTATLEAALLDVPCVAAYKVHWLTAAVARRLLRVRFVTLPNIVADRLVIPEYLQDEAEPIPLAHMLNRLLDAPGEVLAGYAQVRDLLGGPGAIARAAQAILADAGLEPIQDLAPVGAVGTV
ncbi:MAG: lpxB [Cyanobacteria bacterium RYN_339]|nr:lpxB [Cyanobacteria bacterium RYN_339]